jgi:hypothetical protein
MARLDVAAGEGALRTTITRVAALQHEVVDQRALPVHCLGAHPRRSRRQVGDREPREVAAYVGGEHAARRGARHLPEPVAPVPGSQPPGARPGRDPRQVARAHVTTPVALQGQGRHGVGARMHPAEDVAGEVHPQEGVARVGHGIDESVHERGVRGAQPEVLAAERDDPHVARRADHAGQGVAGQAAARDHVVEPVHGRVPGQDRHRPGVLAHRGDRGGEQDAATARPQLQGERGADGHVVDDGGTRRVERRDPRDVGLDLAHAAPVQPDEAGHLVAARPILDVGETRQLAVVEGDDQLAELLVGQAVLGAEVPQHRAAPPAQPGLQRSRLVVEAGVDHPAVVPGLVGGEPVLLLQHDDAQAGEPLRELDGDGEPQDPGADDADAATGDDVRHDLNLPRLT